MGAGGGGRWGDGSLQARGCVDSLPPPSMCCTLRMGASHWMGMTEQWQLRFQVQQDYLSSGPPGSRGQPRGHAVDQAAVLLPTSVSLLALPPLPVPVSSPGDRSLSQAAPRGPWREGQGVPSPVGRCGSLQSCSNSHQLTWLLLIILRRGARTPGGVLTAGAQGLREALGWRSGWPPLPLGQSCPGLQTCTQDACEDAVPRLENPLGTRG